MNTSLTKPSLGRNGIWLRPKPKSNFSRTRRFGQLHPNQYPNVTETVLTFSETPEPLDSDGFTSSSDDNEEPVCRFCFGGQEDGDLVKACSCRGTVAYVHRICLSEWQKYKLTNVCDLCFSPYTDGFQLSWSQRLQNIQRLTLPQVLLVLFFISRIIVDLGSMVVLPIRLAHLTSQAVKEYDEKHEVVSMTNLEAFLVAILFTLRLFDCYRIIHIVHRYVNPV